MPRLDDELDFILLHQTGLMRAAAPEGAQRQPSSAEAYPDLAYILEHLVFLGSARFPANAA